MPLTSSNPPPPPPPHLLFDIILEISRDFMASNPRDSTSSSALLLNSSSTSCISKSHVEDLIQTLKYLFNQGLITIQVATQQEVDPTTTLATLSSLMAAISCTTNDCTESIAHRALEDLLQLSHHSQDLENKQAHHNSTASYLGIASIIALGFAACAMPVGLIPVQTALTQLFDTKWKERKISQLGEKVKVVKANQFIIHSMIIKVAKMKTMVQDLVSLVAKSENAEHHENLLDQLKNALVEALTQLERVELQLKIENLI